jgi:general secretion pathway protein D
MRRITTPGRFIVASILTIFSSATSLQAQRVTAASTPGISDTISVHLRDVDLRAAVEVLGQYLDRPIVISNVTGTKVTIETPQPVHRKDIVGLLRATLQGQHLELIADTAGPYRIQQTEAPSPPPPSMSMGGPTQLFVIHLHHARAADVAATVNALYGRASAFGELGAPTSTSTGHSASTLSQQLQQNQVSPMGTTPMVPAVASVTGTQPATLAGETTIVPDPGTNSLFIRASQADYDLITAAVKELDIRPLQVLIEVQIAEVDLNKSLAYGVDLNLPAAHLPGHPNTTYSGSQVGLGSRAGDVVFNVTGIGGDPNLAATIQAAASRDDVTILSRPSVLAVNNQEAQINVGSQRPFVQLSRTLPTDNGVQDQVVQYQDVGTKLDIKPTISSDGYVMLQVTQEVDEATGEISFNAPVISTRSVQTQLLLKDGQTVVIGGLRDHQHEVDQEGIPFLSRIPVIGGLFGHTSWTTTETELVLFITPRVIKTDDDAQAITGPARKQAGLKTP